MDNKNSNQLSDGIKKILLAGVGAVAATAEKSSEILDDLVEKGELTVEQGKALNKELKHNMEESKKKAEAKKAADKESAETGERPESEKKDFASYVGALTPEQLAALKAEIAKKEESAGKKDKAAEEAE